MFARRRLVGFACAFTGADRRGVLPQRSAHAEQGFKPLLPLLVELPGGPPPSPRA